LFVYVTIHAPPQYHYILICISFRSLMTKL
jgi:hypothetical protein